MRLVFIDAPLSILMQFGRGAGGTAKPATMHLLSKFWRCVVSAFVIIFVPIAGLHMMPIRVSSMVLVKMVPRRNRFVMSYARNDDNAQ